MADPSADEVETAWGTVVSKTNKVESLATAVSADPAAFAVPRVNAGAARSISLGIGVTWIDINPHLPRYLPPNLYRHRRSSSVMGVR